MRTSAFFEREAAGFPLHFKNSSLMVSSGGSKSHILDCFFSYRRLLVRTNLIAGVEASALGG